MKYVVGYTNEGKFVILCETNNLRIALLKAKKESKKRIEEIKIKKRG